MISVTKTMSSSAGGEARAAIHQDKPVQAKAAAPLDVSASVGHDQDHLFRHIPDAGGEQEAEQSPCHDGGHAEAVPAKIENGGVASAAAASEDKKAQPPAVPADPVAQKILEKKRKFHTGRVLELKNLPDGCTEQVG